MRKIFCIGLAFLLMAIVLLGCDDKGTNGGGETPVTLSLAPSSVESSVGNPFEIVVEAKNVEALFGLSCEVKYDGARIEATDVVSRDFFGDDILFFAKIELNVVSIAVTRKKEAGGVSGAGELARIAFQSLQAGQCDVTFDQTTLSMRKEDGSDVDGFSGIVLEKSSVDIK